MLSLSLSFFFSHFTYQKPGAQESRVIFYKITQLISGRIRIWTLSESLLLTTNLTECPPQKGCVWRYVKSPCRAVVLSLAVLQKQLNRFPKYQWPGTASRNFDPLGPEWYLNVNIFYSYPVDANALDWELFGHPYKVHSFSHSSLWSSSVICANMQEN